MASSYFSNVCLIHAISSKIQSHLSTRKRDQFVPVCPFSLSYDASANCWISCHPQVIRDGLSASAGWAWSWQTLMYDIINNTVLRSFSHYCVLFSFTMFPPTLPPSDITLKCSLGVPRFTYTSISYEIYFDIVCSKVYERSVSECARLVGMML